MLLVALLPGCADQQGDSATTVQDPPPQPWEQPGTKVGQETEGPAGITLVWVPGGSFMMGSEDGFDYEQPAHEVELGGFWTGKTEVMMAEWRAVMGGQVRAQR